MEYRRTHDRVEEKKCIKIYIHIYTHSIVTAIVGKWCQYAEITTVKHMLEIIFFHFNGNWTLIKMAALDKWQIFTVSCVHFHWTKHEKTHVAF